MSWAQNINVVATRAQPYGIGTGHFLRPPNNVPFIPEQIRFADKFRHITVHSIVPIHKQAFADLDFKISKFAPEK